MPFPEGLTIAHIEPPERGDCVAGVQLSARKGATSQDVNTHVSRDGVAVGAHWETLAANHKHDPRGVIPRNAHVGHLDMVDLERCGFQSIATILRGAPAGFTVALEAKPDPKLERVETWEQIARDAEAAGRQVVAMTIQSYGHTRRARRSWERHALARMRAASAAGVPTMLLWRHHISPVSRWWSVLDAVKGAPRSQRTPAHVVRLGGTVASATRWGCSVSLRNARRSTRKVRALMRKAHG